MLRFNVNDFCYSLRVRIVVKVQVNIKYCVLSLNFMLKACG